MMVPESQNFKRSFWKSKWFSYYKRREVDYQSLKCFRLWNEKKKYLAKVTFNFKELVQVM